MSTDRPSGRVVALDPGTKRIGVAVSNSDQTMAFPRPALPVDPSGDPTEAILSLVAEELATVVVIGLPKNLSGGEGSAARSARQLAEALESRPDLGTVHVELHDERLTTVEAARALRAAGLDSREQRALIDSAAATVLLEDFLRCR